MKTPNVTKQDFADYLCQQRRGTFNMLDRDNCMLEMGWDPSDEEQRAKYMSIIKNYSELREKYGAK